MIVAHNAQFDMTMLPLGGYFFHRTICTLKLARYLDKNGVIPKYNLQYLRYFLGLEIEATAHDALGDILVLEGLFSRLNAKFQENDQLKDPGSGDDTHQQQSVLMPRMPFGKHKGCLLVRYLRITFCGYLGRNWTRIWRFTVKTHLGHVSDK